MQKYKRFFIIFIFLSIIIVAIPLGIDWFIIGNKVPSNIANSDWVGFLGDYIGAILGCIISAVGIILTIRLTRNENRIDRELQVMPCFEVQYNSVSDSADGEIVPQCTENWLGYIAINVFDGDSNDSDITHSGLLSIKNIGNGPAANVNCSVEVDGCNSKYTAYFRNKNAMVTTHSIGSNQKVDLSIDISNNMKPYPGLTTVMVDNEAKKFVNVNVFPDSFRIRVVLKYNDLLSNKFSQEIFLKTSYFCAAHGESCRYRCSVSLEEIGAPKRK